MISWKWIALGGAGIVLFLSSDTVRFYRDKKKIYRKLTKKLEEAKLANKNLSMEVHRLQTDPKIIGELARKELGLLHPNEIEYRFIVRHSTK